MINTSLQNGQSFVKKFFPDRPGMSNFSHPRIGGKKVCPQLYDKRDAFPISIVSMPHSDNDIQPSIYYVAIDFEISMLSRANLKINIPL